jgi:predicted glutamine amidotransferase
MLGIVPSADSEVDFQFVMSFRNLASCGRVKTGSSKGHVDGWGIVAWRNGDPLYLGREPSDAFSDPKFEEACNSGSKAHIKSPLIAHLRKASLGQKIKENTHPFVLNRWAFAHNGTIRGLKLRSRTDSEWFFQNVMSAHLESGDIVDAISSQIRVVKSKYKPTSLTFLLSNGNEFYAYRDYRSAPDYYGMYHAHLGNSTVFAQEKFFKADWNEMKNGELTIVNKRREIDSIQML